MSLIVPATLDDLDNLVSLENTLFATDRLSRRQFRYLLTRANGMTVKIVVQERMAGYLTLLMRRNSKASRIYSIGIDSSMQYCGYGGMLLTWAEHYSLARGRTSLTLEVSTANTRAIALYCRKGFERRGVRPGYYEDGSTALILAKQFAWMSSQG